jgi:hypothetical protein
VVPRPFVCAISDREVTISRRQKCRTEHSVWWALALILLGAVGMWHLYTVLEERVSRIAKENIKFPAGAIVAFQLARIENAVMIGQN